jgi:hypothetical protein
MLIWTIISLAIPWSTAMTPATAGQVPVVDGVLGGMPDVTLGAAVPTISAVDPDVVRSPGKLRIVENSGCLR